ncbi:MAG: hypothetical protein ABIH42_05280 [Planctomycetota bacterium]
MAEVYNIAYDELGFRGTNVRSFKAQLTGSSSTITSATHKFGSSLNTVIIAVEGTNGATYTISGTTITVTGTNNDYVNCIITGR